MTDIAGTAVPAASDEARRRSNGTGDFAIRTVVVECLEAVHVSRAGRAAIDAVQHVVPQFVSGAEQPHVEAARCCASAAEHEAADRLERRDHPGGRATNHDDVGQAHAREAADQQRRSLLWHHPAPYARYLAVTYLALVFVTFVYFYPHWAAVDVPQWLDNSYYWFDSWR
mgnify:CR=1 FL=1